MTIDEMAFRFSIELGLIAPIFVALSFFVDAPIAIISSVFIAHTINWSLNGNFWSTQKFFGKKQDPKVFAEFLVMVRNRASLHSESVIAIAAFGSLSRRKFSTASDLDMRIVRKRGMLNWIKANSFALKLRAIAFATAFPLDLFVLDGLEEVYNHISIHESPVEIFDPEKSLAKVSPNIISLEQTLSRLR